MAGAITPGVSLLVAHCDWLISTDLVFEPRGFRHSGLSSRTKPPKFSATGADGSKQCMGTPIVAIGWRGRAAGPRVGDGR